MVKFVLFIFKALISLIFITRCFTQELRSLAETDILKAIKNEIKNIPIPSYKKPVERHLTICNIIAKGTQIKTVKSTTSKIESELAKAGLDKAETAVMKGIIFASTLAYKSFNFEVRKSINDYNLRFSQFVGLAKREKDFIEVVFVDVDVTANLYYEIPSLYMKCEANRSPSCPSCSKHNESHFKIIL